MAETKSSSNNSISSIHSKVAPHPTAKAFFDALDKDAISSSNKMSETLKRRSRSLGWRNRHSQEDYYPVSIATTGERTQSFSVQQIQRGEVEGTYGTGATVWPAAMVLIKYLERHPEWVRGKTVVDLGSGTGVTSVAAALLGASNVICTDGEETVVRLASDNVDRAATELSQSSPADAAETSNDDCARIHDCPVRVQKFWWGKDSLQQRQQEEESNDNVLVLVADCVLPKLYPIAPLVQAIDELLPSLQKYNNNDNDNNVAILSYEHRYYPEYDPRDKFRELATERGLHVQTIPQTDMDPVYCVDDIEIWHVTRQNT